MMETRRKRQNITSQKDIAEFTRDTRLRVEPRPVLTEAERDDRQLPMPLVKILDCHTGTVVQASLSDLNHQMREFHKVILLIEDESSFSDACAGALHELGYDGVQLITQLLHAEQHLDDIVSNLTAAPAAIVLGLGLGLDSGFAVLRKC